MAISVRKILFKVLFVIFLLVPLALLVEVPIFLAGAAAGSYLVYSRDLPVIPKRASYQPKTVSTFYADDGTVIGVFYKQKRVVVDVDQIPTHVVNAFLAAEDKRFFVHHGVDWAGFARALGRSILAGRPAQGGSTITMQVTRNFFLSREKRLSRKIKEMILAYELEKLWGKNKILYVYLNEIYLGEGCHGVEAAARGYFDKPVQHLTVAEAAMIAGLVASPTRYNPFKSMDLATQRQATVLQRMVRGGFLTEQEYRQAKEEPLRIKKEVSHPFDLVPDFAEAVRRYIVRKYGEEKLYNEGLKVFTTCRIDYQRKANEAVEKGLAEIKARQKHLAILRTLNKTDIPELLEKRRTPELAEGKIYQGVVVKVVTFKNKETELHVALSKKLTGRVRVIKGGNAYKYGHVLALRFDRFVDDIPYFSLDEDPRLQSALVCIENNTGYVRALVGGSSGERFQFNRAVQAKRQPGSAFKPLIYSVALEQKSYSPATIIVDEPIVVGSGEDDEDELSQTSQQTQPAEHRPDQQDVKKKNDEDWTPKNSEGGFLGPLTFRRALELSRNICTIKILMDVGFDPVIALAHRMGITAPLGRNLSLSLGTSEMTLYELTSAYTVFPNGGMYVEPVLVKRIEDRFGDVLEDNTHVDVLDDNQIPRPVPREELKSLPALYPTQQPDQAEEEDLAPEDSPEPSNQAVRGPRRNIAGRAQKGEGTGEEPRVRAAMSPQTAYIMTSLLQGAVGQGTGSRLSHYMKRRDLAGKTGTTNRAEDTWFVGFNPEFTTGVWVGYDEKRPLGSQEAGGRAALPIWAYYMRDVLENRPQRDFSVPPDITFQEVLTYAGNPKDGFVPKMVREPVYRPFAGKTLVSWPDDTPERLAEYKGIAIPGVPYFPDQAYPDGQYHPVLPDGSAAVQPVQQVVPPVPLVPMEGGVRPVEGQRSTMYDAMPVQPLPGARVPTPPAAVRATSPDAQVGPVGQAGPYPPAPARTGRSSKASAAGKKTSKAPAKKPDPKPR